MYEHIDGTAISATCIYNAATTIGKISLTKGLWIIIASVECYGNSNMAGNVADVSIYGNILSGSVSLICQKDYTWERKQFIAVYKATSDTEVHVSCTPYFSPTDGQIDVKSLIALKIR